MTDTPDLATRLQAVAMSIPPLTKDATNSYLNADYLTLPKLLAAVRPLLAQNGLTLTSKLMHAGNGCFVVKTTISVGLKASASEWEELVSEFPVVDLAPQKVAAAATYGMRVNLMQMLALAAVDNDGNPPLNQEAPNPVPSIAQSPSAAPSPQGAPSGPPLTPHDLAGQPPAWF